MESGHVEIHDPFTNHQDRDPESTTDTDDMEDTPEFRLLMAYAQRRRVIKSPADESSAGHEAQEGSLPNGDANTEVKRRRKRRKGWKRLAKLFPCITPQTKQSEPSPARGSSCRGGYFRAGEEGEDEKLEEAASRLTEIADEIRFVPPELEADSADDVERVMGLLLREIGDNVSQRQEEELKKAISSIFWNYDFFTRLVSTLLTRMGFPSSTPANPQPQTSDRKQIAVTCEITSRLTAADTLPGNRLLGLGARYLREHHSAWAQRQGGYEEAFYSDDEDDDQ
ncbi:uncharacterized protein LOC141810729 [Halichoeres trimaculatus]|uniref:uncharacterized protein LOC141810729 n=1 Tax=Halichoeres trimaculatus TaxID=147232 RepID=UPI003D9F42F1